MPMRKLAAGWTVREAHGKTPVGRPTGVEGDRPSVVGREECRDGSAVAIFNEPQSLGLRWVDENLEVVDALVLLRESLEESEAGEDHVAVSGERGRRGEKWLLPRLKEIAGCGMVERDLLRLKGRERHGGEEKEVEKRGEGDVPSPPWGLCGYLCLVFPRLD